MNISLASLLNLRTQWEHEVENFKFPDEENYNGTLNNLAWFLKHGYKSNSLRPGFDNAIYLSEQIIKECRHGNKKPRKRVTVGTS